MDRLRVLTLNIWNRQGPWAERLRLIRSGVESLNPDVIGLQEVLHHDQEPIDQAQEIAAGLGYHVAFASAWHIGFGLQFGNAILSRFPITHAENFELPGETGEETRALLHAQLESPVGVIPVFNTHLTWQLHHGSVRERQVVFIAERIRELAPTGDGFPPILMGDFNAEPDSDEIRFLRGLTGRLGKSVYLADCFSAVGDGSPGYTFARANPYAARACEPNRRLDYIFVRGPDRLLRGEPLHARVVFDKPQGEVFPSDHYGVFAEIQAVPRTLPSL
jgi:endonuclease/exonuclease/phosphatase family metal-dependent hydrolase